MSISWAGRKYPKYLVTRLEVAILQSKNFKMPLHLHQLLLVLGKIVLTKFCVTQVKWNQLIQHEANVF
jgi:hypothetical protein